MGVVTLLTHRPKKAARRQPTLETAEAPGGVTRGFPRIGLGSAHERSTIREEQARTQAKALM